MANLIAYAEDKTLAEDMRTVTHLLWLDVALHSVGNRFVAVSPRMYGNNKAGNRAVFEGGTVRYGSACGDLAVSYDGLFTVNGAPVATPFDRYDCRFCHAPWGAEEILVDSGRHSLTLRLTGGR